MRWSGKQQHREMQIEANQASAGKDTGFRPIKWQQIDNVMLTFLCFTNYPRPAILSEVGIDFHCPWRQFV
jgi:hypothetical protein